MKLLIHPRAADVTQAVAGRIAAAIRARPSLVLGLATGRTPVPIYQQLVALGSAGRVDFRRLRTFNLDEFIGLSSAHPGSYRAYMEAHFLRPAGIDPVRVHFPDGLASDVRAECERYEAAIAAAGGIDLQVLGLGENGHIGFNEPASALEARTHRARLAAQTRQANAVFFGGRPDLVPEEALSMGVGTILSAREILLAATGRHKRRAVARMVEGPVTTRLPASFLQLHPHVEIHVDHEAAGLLSTPPGATAGELATL